MAELNYSNIRVCLINSTEQKVKLIKTKGNKTMGIKGKVDKMVVLACEECKERNYTTTKNKKNIKERLELKKYCSRCKKTTPHKETK